MSGREAHPRKRPAFESAALLAQPVAHDPGMKRPVTTVAGSALVLLRAAAGAVWAMALAFGWSSWVQGFAAAFGGDASEEIAPAGGLSQALMLTVLVLVGASVVLEAVLGVLILRGRNGPRMFVMILSTLSILSAFVGWWAQGQEIRIETTFLTIALDIFILLALSSRSAAAYARRFERHRPADSGHRGARG